MSSRRDWSTAENAVLVRAYLEMLRRELSGQEYSKTQFRRDLDAQIERGNGAIEYKLQNVSAALYEINHPFIRGYKPAKNLQQALREEVLRQLDTARDIEKLAFEALRKTEPRSSADLIWSEPDAPVIELDDRPYGIAHPRRIDFVRIDAENHSLGLAGEVAVLDRERTHLTALGRDDLAQRVEHISQTLGDGAGFDVLSFTPEGAEKYIEVKTTRLGKFWPMLITRNEVAFSQTEPDRFNLYRVYDFAAARVGLSVLQGDVTQSCRLSPKSYQAVPA
jgi:hypothetical protein